ncbi:hypothetical protein J4Q44_G00360710 [Coregonus suidteri]|uniref:Anaphase-promoting complex subunit 1 n=1 Tax=Coregonus suidteri TaxID=861788 RepID=A0AAN8KR08_9TELE
MLEAPASTDADKEVVMTDLNQDVIGLIWSQDLHVQEARCLLQSSRPVRLSVVHLAEVSDHEDVEEKENKDLFTIFSYHPVSTEPLPVFKLNLTDLNSGNIDLPPKKTSWSSFHNGVAAGLKIASASQVDSAWMAYNKPKSLDQANEYTGFLMALGLNRHLSKLATLNIHVYFTKGHEMTSIGQLLGVSGAKLSTMDMSITRLLSIHIPALLPPTSTDLDVPHNVQVAAMLGIGLVNQDTGHRHNAEVCSPEIGRLPLVLRWSTAQTESHTPWAGPGDGLAGAWQ